MGLRCSRSRQNATKQEPHENHDSIKGYTASDVPSFPIAHLDIMDVELVIVFLDQESARRASAIYADLEKSAARVGLNGDIVAVWQDEFGRSRFLAPPEQHAFFRIAGYDQLYAQVNGTLECSS